jgi:hypothetical protein
MSKIYIFFCNYLNKMARLSESSLQASLLTAPDTTVGDILQACQRQRSYQRSVLAFELEDKSSAVILPEVEKVEPLLIKEELDADNVDEDIESADYSEVFKAVPLNPMEEASRKLLQGSQQKPPTADDWRSELKQEGREMASTWGKRDKNTRAVEPFELPPSLPEPSSTAPKRKNPWNQE